MSDWRRPRSASMSIEAISVLAYWTMTPESALGANRWAQRRWSVQPWGHRVLPSPSLGISTYLLSTFGLNTSAHRETCANRISGRTLDQ